MTPGHTRYHPATGVPRWNFVAGRTFLAAFESTAAHSIVDTLWWLAESDLATIESVVGAFPLAGDGAVRSFAVATIDIQHETGEGHVTAVVRGDACVDVFSVGGARRFSAGQTQPWVLAEFRSVTGLVLGGDDHPTGPVAQAATDSLPVGTGVVGGESLVWSLAPIERTVEKPVVVREPTTRAAVAEETDETIIRARRHAPAAPAVSEAEPEPELENEAEVEVGPEPEIEARVAGPSGESVATAAIQLPELGHPGFHAGRRPVLAERPDVPLGFRIGGADPIDLELPVLIGRSPRGPRLSTGVEPRLISVPSPDQQVSSTHVQLEQVGDTVVVTDLRSTNGTLVASSNGISSRLKPGESIVVLPGARVDIGDGNIIEITPARGDS